MVRAKLRVFLGLSSLILFFQNCSRFDSHQFSVFAGTSTGSESPLNSGSGSDTGTAANSSASDSSRAAKSNYLFQDNSQFLFYLQDLGIGHFTAEKLRDAVSLFKIGDPVVVKSAGLFVDPTGKPVPMIGEWDYSGMNVEASAYDGGGVYRGQYPCFDSKQGCADPLHAGEAFDRMHSYLMARKAVEFSANPGATSFIAHTGHHYFQHYGASWGASMVVSEVGENINSAQAHLAFTRGAARQFKIPWGMDMSPWFGQGVTDYWQGGERVWCSSRDANGNCTFWNSSPDGGHSLSLNERIWTLSYLGGASLLIQEGGSINFFSSPRAEANLSPLGELSKKFRAFTSKTTRGEPFTPYAVMINHYHGLGLGTWSTRGQEKTWNHFPMSEEEKHPLRLFEAIWPGAFYSDPDPDESKYMVEAPIGDTVDVLTDAASYDVMSRYNVLFLSGTINWNTRLKSDIWNGFLPRGGWVVLERGPTQDAIFADFGNPHLDAFVPGYTAEQIGTTAIGGGRFVRVSDPALYPLVIKEIEKYFNPFLVTGEVSYSISRLSQTKWLFAVINNYGLTKKPLAPPSIAYGQGRAVQVKLRRGIFKKIQQVYGTPGLVGSSTQFEIGIPQGEVVVFELETDI